jgi:hypothetical protein
MSAKFYCGYCDETFYSERRFNEHLEEKDHVAKVQWKINDGRMVNKTNAKKQAIQSIKMTDLGKI